MDNLGVFLKQHKSGYVESDDGTITKSLGKKQNCYHAKKWITRGSKTINSNKLKYKCSPCGFSTYNLKDYRRHLKTKKHEKKNPKKTPDCHGKGYICGCGKSYKYASGLSKHRLKCFFENEKFDEFLKKSKKSKKIKNGEKNLAENGKNGEKNKILKFSAAKASGDDGVFQQTIFDSEYDNNNNNKIVKNSENIFSQSDKVFQQDKNDTSSHKELQKMMKQSLNQTETINKLLEQNAVLIEKLSNLPKNNITYQNCGNKKMTINVYLNKTCKDAMNLSDFVNGLNISLDDLLYTQQHGYIKGISNIFVKHLNDLEPSERPIHCSDTKRLQFYVRDENKWQKDKKNKKIDKSIQDLTIKQIKHLKEWETRNPNYLQDDKLLSQWQKLVHEIMGPAGDVAREKEKEQIKKAIGNKVEFKNSLIIKK